MLDLTQYVPQTAAPRSHYAPTARAPQRWPAPVVAALIVACAVTAFANFNVIWNHFYNGVPQLFDTGWYAHLVHRNAPILHNPPTVAFHTINQEFYSTHYAPALWLLSLPTYVLPVGPQVWLASLEALKYAWIAALAWCCVRAALVMDAPHGTQLAAVPVPRGRRVLAGAVVLLAPFNGVLLACIAYPHFETWFVPLALGFFWTLLRGHTLPAIAFFVAALLVREDAGFHLCALLTVSAAAAWLVRRRWDREMTRWLGFAAAGFVGSCVALLIMKLLFPGDNAFARVYLGDPPFAHLTWPRIVHVLSVHFEHRGYLWMPVLVYALWGATCRSWWGLIGYAAFLPWLLFNFVAKSINPATLSLYYAYPFAVALLWPLVGRLAFDRSQNPTRTLAWIAAALAVSIAGYVRGDNDWRGLVRSMAFPTAGSKSTLDSVAGNLADARARGERLSIDDAVAGLAPGAFDTRNLFGQSPPGVTLAGFFSNGRARKIAWENTRSLPFHYEVTGTPLAVVSEKPLSWPHLELVSTAPGSILTFLAQPVSRLAWTEMQGSENLRIVCEGPDHWYLWSGETWNATFTLSLEPFDGAPARETAVVCEVLAHEPNTTTVVATTAIPLPSEASGRIQIHRTLEFVVPGERGADIAVRVRAPGRSSGRVEDVALQPVKMLPRDAAGNPRR